MHPRDKQLLDLAAGNATPVEMERETGIPAAQAVNRVKQLLASRDVWSELERRQLLLHDLYNVKNKLMSEAGDDRTTLRAISLLSDTLDRQSALTAEEMSRVSEVQARKMLDMIGMAFRFMEESHPEVADASLRNAFARGLEAAHREVTK